MADQVLQTGGKIINVASGDLGASVTSYTYFLVAAEKPSKGFSLKVSPTATTITLEFTNEDTAAGTHWMAAGATALAALNWTDLTSELTGAATQTAAFSVTTDAGNFPWKLGRVKRVTTNATNSVTAFLHRN